VSVYALARYIGDDDAMPPGAAEQIKLGMPAKQVAKTDKGIAKTEPHHGPPWLGKKLLTLRKQVIDTALQLQFQQLLFAELEAVAMDRVAASGRQRQTRSA